MLRNQEKNRDKSHYRLHTETNVGMGRTYSKNEEQTLHRMATKRREEIKGTTTQKMARRHNKEGGTTWNRKATDRRQWKTLMEGHILQWMDRA